MFLLGISEEAAVAEDQTLLMIGTRKGLWIGRSDAERREWSIDGPYLPLMEVYSCMIDTRGERPRLLAGASLSWTGPQVFSSDDLGKTWQEHPIGFPEGIGRLGRARLAAHSRPGGRRGVRRHGARRGLPLHRQR